MDETFIARRLAKLRTEMGVSAREMSLSIGQSNNYISNIENGKSFPSIKGLYYICGFLKISPKDFFAEEYAYPPLLNEVIEELKPLNCKSLECLLGFVRELRAK